MPNGSKPDLVEYGIALAVIGAGIIVAALAVAIDWSAALDIVLGLLGH